MSAERLVFKIPYESVDDIPLDEYKNLHKKYWTFIADNWMRIKPNIVSQKTNQDIEILLNCFACGYAIKIAYGDSPLCKFCPLILNKQHFTGECLNGKYKLWSCTHSKTVALEIANMEWKDIYTKNSET